MFRLQASLVSLGDNIYVFSYHPTVLALNGIIKNIPEHDKENKYSTIQFREKYYEDAIRRIRETLPQACAKGRLDFLLRDLKVLHPCIGVRHVNLHVHLGLRLSHTLAGT